MVNLKYIVKNKDELESLERDVEKVLEQFVIDTKDAVFVNYEEPRTVRFCLSHDSTVHANADRARPVEVVFQFYYR